MIVGEGPWRPHNSLSTQRLSCCGVRKVSADRWRRRSQNIGERGALLPKQKVQALQKVSGQFFLGASTNKSARRSLSQHICALTLEKVKEPLQR